MLRVTFGLAAIICLLQFDGTDFEQILLLGLMPDAKLQTRHHSEDSLQLRSTRKEMSGSLTADPQDDGMTPGYGHPKIYTDSLKFRTNGKPMVHQRKPWSPSI